MSQRHSPITVAVDIIDLQAMTTLFEVSGRMVLGARYCLGQNECHKGIVQLLLQ